MRRLFYVIGIVAVVVVAVIAVGIGVVAYKGNALDTESRAFVDNAVSAIAGTWTKQQLLERATPELREKTKPQELTALFDTLSRLGPLVEYEGATGQATMSYMTGSGGGISASYVAKARFRNGGASFRIGLVKRDDQWMINSFYVDLVPPEQPGRRI
ncbi:hypothetical protein [Reyranella soli]|uniref:DUF4440 domain-containing protein n=1 Tax=Reyranella soli TaxID=1230389 RepID=A0A512NRT9_9HYPH|nr:hypothetical protein [Reyranella soli]GEP61659.1 hypothetical protein RSO01_88250 [Reyranella soli]